MVISKATPISFMIDIDIILDAKNTSATDLFIYEKTIFSFYPSLPD